MRHNFVVLCAFQLNFFLLLLDNREIKVEHRTKRATKHDNFVSHMSDSGLREEYSLECR